MDSYVDISELDDFPAFLCGLMQRCLDTEPSIAPSSKKALTTRPLRELVEDSELLVPASLPEMLQSFSAPSRKDILQLPRSSDLSYREKHTHHAVYLAVIMNPDKTLLPYAGSACEMAKGCYTRFQTWKSVHLARMPAYVKKALDRGGKVVLHTPLVLIKSLAVSVEQGLASPDMTWYQHVGMIQLLEHTMTAVFQTPYRPSARKSWNGHWASYLVAESPWPHNALPWKHGLSSHAPLTKGVAGMRDEYTREELEQAEQTRLAKDAAYFKAYNERLSKGRALLREFGKDLDESLLNDEQKFQVRLARRARVHKNAESEGRALANLVNAGELDRKDLDAEQVKKVDLAEHRKEKDRENYAKRPKQPTSDKAKARKDTVKLGRVIFKDIKKGTRQLHELNEEEAEQYRLAKMDKETEQKRYKKKKLAKK